MKKEEATKLLDLLNLNELEYIKKGLLKLKDNLQTTYLNDLLVSIQKKLENYLDKQLIIENILLTEINYDELRKRKLLTVQKTFEKYITTVLSPGYDKANIYGEVDGLFTFTNFVSFYQLNNPLYISEFIIDKQRKGSRWEHRSRSANELELEKYLYKINSMVGCNMRLVEFEDKNIEKNIVTFESKEIRHSFNILQMNYMEKFLGEKVTTYISEKTPIVYGESDKGRGFVLGLKYHQ